MQTNYFTLAKSRQLFSCNPRMEKALQSVAAQSSSEPANVNVEVVDPPSKPINPPSPTKPSQITSALKGIPPALLEKVLHFQPYYCHLLNVFLWFLIFNCLSFWRYELGKLPKPWKQWHVHLPNARKLFNMPVSQSFQEYWEMSLL